MGREHLRIRWRACRTPVQCSPVPQQTPAHSTGLRFRADVAGAGTGGPHSPSVSAGEGPRLRLLRRLLRLLLRRLLCGSLRRGGRLLLRRRQRHARRARRACAAQRSTHAASALAPPAAGAQLQQAARLRACWQVPEFLSL
jgi:hypothetical protein